MMTQSHVLITAFLGDRMHRRGARVRRLAFALGGLMPDVPLIVLTLGYFGWRRWVAPADDGFVFGPAYDALYFGDPIWIFLTSLFHAPLFIAAYALYARCTGRPRLWWFAMGCALHTIIDVFTHHNDGPLLLYPFDWSYRFAAPLSYWHPAYGGATFALYENLLDLAIVGYFLFRAMGVAARRLREARAR